MNAWFWVLTMYMASSLCPNSLHLWGLYILATSITQLNKKCFRNIYIPTIGGDIEKVGFFRKVSSEGMAKQGILKCWGAIFTHVQTSASSLTFDPTSFNHRLKMVLYFRIKAKWEWYIKAWCLFEKRFSRKTENIFLLPLDLTPYNLQIKEGSLLLI